MWKSLCLIIMFNLMCLEVYAQKRTDYAAELVKAQAALSEQDYTTAYLEYFRAATVSNNPLAQFSLASFYQFGWGRPVDQATACDWYAKSAPGNIPAAQHYYAECLRKGIKGTAEPAQAALWYQRAAENGHVISLCSLAELYIKGEGVNKDTQRGLALCQQAANAGLTKAMLRMAHFYLSDEPALKNRERAHNYLVQAAQGRNAEAQFMLATFYREDNGQSVSDKPARQWFELAAANGYVPAYYQVGVLYFNAPHDPATKALPADDLAKAYLWLSAAAQRSQNEDELRESKELLEKIASLMPKTWLGPLNKKLDEHLQHFPAVADNGLVSKR